MRIRGLLGVLIAAVFLADSVLPLATAWQEDCRTHRHQPTPHTLHGHGESAAAAVAVGEPSGAPTEGCPHCADACAAMTACSGQAAARAAARPSLVAPVGSKPAEGRDALRPSGPRWSPPTPPPLSA